MHAKTSLGFGLPLIGLLGYACQEYDTGLLTPGPDASTTGGAGGSAGSAPNDAAVDVSVGGSSTEPFWPTETDAGCVSESPPTLAQRPTEGETSELPPIYLAMSRVRLGSAADNDTLTFDTSAWQQIGFDLDRRCTSSSTCSVGSEGELVRERGCRNELINPFDGASCRDNAIGGLFSLAQSPLIGEPFGLTEVHWNCALLHGEFSILFKISGYNGQLDDPEVRLDIYASSGLPGLSTPICGPGGEPPPENWWQNAPWLSTEPWRVGRRYLADPTATTEPGSLPDSRYADAAAYVRGGYLVAQLPSPTEFWFSGERAHTEGARFLVHRGVIAARLELGRTELWSISDGVIGGALKPGELIDGFRQLGLCENLCDSYNGFIGYVNQQRDILVGTDEWLPDTDCDGLSLGMQFDAKQATPGELVDFPEPVDCPEPPPGVPPHGCVCPVGGGQCAGAGGAGGASGAGGVAAGGSAAGGSAAGGSAAGGSAAGGSAAGGSAAGGAAGG